MSRDLRRYGRQTNIRLFAGFTILLLVIGGGLVFLIYGPAALPAYLLCLGAGLAPLLLIVLILYGLDWIVRRSNQEQ
jgi:hypothetical protein